MLAMVKCSACNNPFQVESSALGKEVACPHCQAIVIAQAAPIAMPVARPIATGTPEAPLRFDDADERTITTTAPTVPAPTGAPLKRTMPTPVKVGLIGLLTLLAMALVYIGFQYGSGNVPSGLWVELQPEGGRCRLLMPGTPEISTMDAPGRGTPGQRFDVSRWFEKVDAVFGWFDLPENAIPFVNIDGLAKRHAEALSRMHNGSIVREGVVRFGGYDGREFIIDTDKGRWIERIILVPSKPQPRVYIMGIGGPNLEQDSPTTINYFHSLRLQIVRE